MRSTKTACIIPTPWILLTLSVLCCYMLWHPEPVPLAQLPTPTIKADLENSPGGDDDPFAFFRGQQRNQTTLHRVELPVPVLEEAPLFYCLLPSPLLTLIAHVVSPLSFEEESRRIPDSQAAFCHFSRSPPLA